jgi:hypothetical protein
MLGKGIKDLTKDLKEYSGEPVITSSWAVSRALFKQPFCSSNRLPAGEISGLVCRFRIF